METVSLVKKDGKGLRFTDNKKTTPVKSALKEKLQEIYDDLKQLHADPYAKKAEGHAFTANSANKTDITTILGSQKPSFVMFSPPYLNTFDYTEVYKLELWFLDFVKNYDEFKALRARTLRSHNLWKWESTKMWNNELLNQIIDGIKKQELWTEALPIMIQGYFDDMFQCLKNLNDIMEDGAHCVIVVGNSCYGNIQIPTDLLLSKAAMGAHFELEEIRVARQLNTSSQQLRYIKDKALRKYLRESIIILRKKTIHCL